MQPATHTGWFLFCPIFLADVESEGPIVWARWSMLEPLFAIAYCLQASAIAVLSLIDDEYEPGWMFWHVQPIGDCNA